MYVYIYIIAKLTKPKGNSNHDKMPLPEDIVSIQNYHRFNSQFSRQSAA